MEHITEHKIEKKKISWGSLAEVFNYSRKSKAKSYGFPLTNAGKDVQIAMDSKLEHSGHFNTIDNIVASGGISSLPQFLGYPYLAGLQQNGFIRAGVEGLADDMTESWIDVIRNQATDEANIDKVSKIKTRLEELKVKDFFNKAAAMCGYFGGCLIFIDTGDDEDLAAALDEKSLNNSIKRLVLIEPINTYPGRYNSSDPLSKDYYNPSTWYVLGREVHISRLLYFRSDDISLILKPAYNFYGTPPAQMAVDAVSHFLKDRESASRLLNKFSLLVFKTDMGSTLYNGNPEELYKRIKLLADFRDNDSVEVIDKEEEDIVSVTTSLGGVSDLVRLSLELMPIMFRMPLTKFLGISPGGMNATGESDENNWNKYVLSQCEKIFRTPLTRLLELLQYDLFKEKDESITFVFNERSNRDETNQVQNNLAKSGMLINLVSTGIISPEEARVYLAKDENSGFNDIDVEEIPTEEAGEFDDFNLDLTTDEYAEDKFKEEDVKRDDKGRFTNNGSSSSSMSAEEKIKSIDIDFNKDNTLPNLNKETLEEYGLSDKPVLLKKTIIDKNKARHPDITEEDAKTIIGNSLYKPEAILKANPEKPAYHNFITRLEDDKNSIVLLELSEEKENYEIVNYHWLDDYGVRKKNNKAKMGGQAPNNIE